MTKAGTATERPRNWPLRLAVLVEIGLLAALSPGMMPAGMALGMLLLGLFLPGFHVDRIGEVIVVLFSGVGAYVIVMVLGEPDAYLSARSIGPVGASFGLFFLLSAITRMYLQQPYGGDPLTAAALFLGVLSMGGSSSGNVYPAGAVIVLVLLVAACRHGDEARPTLFSVSRKGVGVFVVMLVVWAGLFIGFITALPMAYRWGFSMIQKAYLAPATGFGFSLALGDLDGLLQSETLVMRIDGPRPDHLRGAVYSRYSNGRWLREKGKETVRTLALEPDVRDGVIISLVSGARDRFFIPLGANPFHVNGGRASISTSGIVFPADGEKAEKIAFETTGDDGPVKMLPNENHLAIPKELDETLRKTLSDFGLEGKTGRALLHALTVRLKRDFEYSLTVTVGRGEPIAAFLTRTKKGHCEYFASAMALLARRAGIPTRVVGGYRVHEFNPVGEYYVVREKNAHSWVEAYVEGEGWRTYDPTPNLELFSLDEANTPLFFAIVDVLAGKMRAAAEAVSDMTPVEMASVIGALLVIWIGVRLVRRIRFKKTVVVKGRAYSEPPAALSALLITLAGLGFRRFRSEPLERFADRIESSDADPGLGAAEAGRLLRQYAAWRFGGDGDEAALISSFENWLSKKK